MPYRLGMTLHEPFTTRSAGGVAVAPDALPTAVLSRNGADTAVVVTVAAKAGLGAYDVSVALTTGNGFAAGDACSIRSLSTIGGVANIPCEVCSFVLDNGVQLLGGLGANAVTITVRADPLHTPIAGATVLILDSTATYSCGVAITNGAGQAVFHLSDGTYTLRALAVGYTFADAVLTVAGATAQNIDGTAYTAHPSPVVVVVCGSVGTVVGAIAEVVQGDTTTPLEGRLREANGTTVVDLSTAVAVTFRMREGGTGTAIGGVCSITDAVNGKVQYFWGAHDLDTVGNYLAEFEVQWPGPLYETFPARAPFEIHVRPELG